MGAYENPAMIIDNSGQILAAGMQQGIQAVAKGVEAYGAQVGRAKQALIEARRKRAQQIQVANNKALIDGAKQQASYNQKRADEIKNINKENGVVAGIMTGEVYDDIESKKREIASAYADSNNPSLSEEAILDGQRRVIEYEQQGTSGLSYAANVGLWQKAGQQYVDNPLKFATYESDGIDIDQSRNMAMAFSIDLMEGKISKDVSFKKTPDYTTGLMTVKFYDSDNNETFSASLDMSNDDALDAFFGENYDFTSTMEEANEINTNKDGGLKSIFFKERVQYVEGDKIISKDIYNIDEIKRAYGPAIDTMVNTLTNFGSEQPGKEYRKTEAWLRNIGVDPDEIKEIMKSKNPSSSIREDVEDYLLNQLSNNKYRFIDNQFFTQTESNINTNNGRQLTNTQKTAQLFRRGWKKSLADISAYNRKFVARPVDAQGALVTDDINNIAGYALYGEKQRDGNITLEPVYASTKVFTNPEELLQVIGNPEADIFAGVNVE